MISDLSLCGRCIDWFRQFIRLFQTFRKLNATYFSCFFVAFPAASCNITTYNTFQWKHIKFTAHHAVSIKLILLKIFRHIFYVCRYHMIWQNIFCHFKPELRHLCKNRSFFCNYVVQDYIKTTDTICSYHDQTVTIVINLAYFTFFYRFHFLHNPYLAIFLLYLQIIPVQTYHLLPLIVKSQISSFPFFSLLIIVFSFFFTFVFELLVLFIYTFSSCIDILFIVKIEKIM